MTWNPETESYVGSEQQAEEAARLLDAALSSFKTGGFEGAQRTITLGPTVSSLGGNAGGNGDGSSESTDVTDTETGKKADELIQGLK